MPAGQNEASSRILINKALEFSKWDLLNLQEVRLELSMADGRADYTLPLKLPPEKKEPQPPIPYPPIGGGGEPIHDGPGEPPSPEPPRAIPIWKGTDTLVSREVIEVGPEGEKVDVMTFRGSFESDVKKFAAADAGLKTAIADEDDDAVETIMNERFEHRDEVFEALRQSTLVWRSMLATNS
jgi:hypothetical protein